MVDMIPGSPLDRAYKLYRDCGGNPHDPDKETMGRFIRIILIWTPLRWVFSLHPAARILWLCMAVSALLLPLFWTYIALVGIIVLLIQDTCDLIGWSGARWHAKRQKPAPEKLSVRLK